MFVKGARVTAYVRNVTHELGEVTKALAAHVAGSQVWGFECFSLPDVSLA